MDTATIGAQVEVGDQVITHFDSRARLDLSNGTIIRVGPLSSLTLEDPGAGDAPRTLFSLDIGAMWIILNGGQVEVDTPAGLATVRGSYLYVEANPNTGETAITCLEGTCTLSNGGGQVILSAGQTATVLNSITPPITGTMSDDDVADWLAHNPEATLVVLPLTEGAPAANTASATATLTATSTHTATATATLTPTDAACGPPLTWIAYTIQEGETFERIVEAFQMSASDFQRANCLGSTRTIYAGMILFVPDVATITPSPTNTATATSTLRGPGATSTSEAKGTSVAQTKTATITPTKTATTTPTKTATPTPTEMPTDIVDHVTYAAGPKDGNAISSCVQYFEATAADNDGVTSVALHWSLSDPTVAAPDGAFTLNKLSSSWGASVQIPTDGSAGTDTVYWKFAMVDGLDNTTYSAVYSYSDSLDCAADTVVSDSQHPNGVTITDAASCSQQYMLEMTDADGFKEVNLEYSLNDPTFALFNSAPLPSTTYNIYKDSIDIDSTPAGTPPPDVIVYFRFYIEDNLGNVLYQPSTGSFSFTDAVGCDGTSGP